MIRIFAFISLITLISNISLAQNSYSKPFIYPSNWWIGMKNTKLQVLLRSTENDFSKLPVKISYQGISLLKVHTFDNTNYLALDLNILRTTKPGEVKIKIGKETFLLPLEYKNKLKNGKDYAQGVTSKDFVYLLMPDRFANGNSDNDKIVGMKDQSLNRDTVFNRHGGDLQGVIDHLDYFNELGVTALWLNPVLENDMPDRTEHGYAITNHYRVDPRLGGNNKYKELIKLAHKKNIKVIQDAIYNHIGADHWIMVDPPSKNWVHQWPKYQNTSFKDQVVIDPHASKEDIKIMSEGWFTPLMPDLNQENAFVANFLIQHAIWCVEEFGIDGWRIDTYPFNNLDFMNRCNQALLDEYPTISIFGETWVHGTINQSYYTKNKLNVPFKSNLPGVTDFQLLWGINDVMSKPFGWTSGVNVLYSNLAQDIIYENPNDLVIFLDNHDLSRAYSVYEKNQSKLNMALAWLLTCRGIPQIYYGTEILLEGFTTPNDGHVRQDFPGGWIADPKNKFKKSERTPSENVTFDLIAKIAHFRINSKALQFGKLTQFTPEDGIYVYFRHTSDETIMCIMNTNNISKEVKVERFAERCNPFSQFQNIINDEINGLDKPISIMPHTMIVAKLIK